MKVMTYFGYTVYYKDDVATIIGEIDSKALDGYVWNYNDSNSVTVYGDWIGALNDLTGANKVIYKDLKGKADFRFLDFIKQARAVHRDAREKKQTKEDLFVDIMDKLWIFYLALAYLGYVIFKYTIMDTNICLLSLLIIVAMGFYITYIYGYKPSKYRNHKKMEELARELSIEVQNNESLLSDVISADLDLTPKAEYTIQLLEDKDNTCTTYEVPMGYMNYLYEEKLILKK